MFRHNFLIAFRNFNRSRVPFFINLVGLSVGLACTLLIYLWVNDELSVDAFHEKGDRLVQVLQNMPTPNGIITNENTPGPLAKVLADEVPTVEHAVSVVPYEWFEGEKFMLSDGDKRFFSARNQFASADYFKIFSYPLVQGNKDQVLADRNSVAISAALAQKLFNTTDAMGKTVEWIHPEVGGRYRVSGVFEIPPRSSAQFDAVFHYDIFLEQNENLTVWTNSDPYTYVTLKPNVHLDQFNAQINDFPATKSASTEETLVGQLYSEKYLHGQYENGQPSGGRITYVRLFSTIALFILAIACINFINLSTARASTRMKEVGVKKVVGSGRRSLIVQYITESVVMAFIALLVALALVALLLPQFEVIAGKDILLVFNPGITLSILAITLLTGILSGSYPALYLSGISPVRALKGERNRNFSGQWVRRGLVVFQFAVSAILIVSVVIVYQQIELIQSKKLGYNKDNIIRFAPGIQEANPTTGTHALPEEDRERFLQLLRNTPGVVDATNYAHHMVGDFGTTTGVDWPGKDPNRDLLFAQIAGGYDFIETTNIKLKEGRSYSRKFSTDHEKIIFNEAAIRAMGLKDPVGQVITLWGEEREIIGVTDDFHIDKLYERIMPVFITLSTDDFASNMMVKIAAGHERATLDRIASVYQDHFVAGMPFEFEFLDESYQRLYAQEIRVGMLSRYAAGVAIFISCLGLFGFATFTVQRRLKEIGIRKVMGADSFNITYLLTADFTKMVLWAVVVSLPVSYFITQRWLAGFAYRIDLEWWFFAGAGLLILLIAWLTVGLQTVKAARSNPVACLKDE